MRHRLEPQFLNVAEAFTQLNLDDLRPLGKLVSHDAPSRKQDLVPYLTQKLAREDVVRRLYESLDNLGQAAVQEALADPMGTVDPNRFQAKYGRLPNLGTRKSAAPLRLFMPGSWSVPTDLRPILKTFVPEPRAVSISTSDELPSTVPRQVPSWLLSRGEKPEPRPLRQRLTAGAALREIPAMLRLVDAGKVRVGEKSRKPGEATVQAIAPLLVNGDFYQAEDKSDYPHDPGFDLAIRAFAWPCILQAAGLASLSAGKLSLSRAGRKALTQPAQDVIRHAWDKWVNTKVFDEFERIDAIKGKQSARLSAAVDRRVAVNDVLAECPAGRWIAADEFFRFIRASGEDFPIARNLWKLYIAEQPYGSLGYEGRHSWEMLQGRFVLATLFEYAATLGVIDIAYIPPQEARNDYRNCWGTDDYECLSRYDGLKFFRINALGAWCLGLTQEYEPEPLLAEKTWRVLPNHDVVSIEPNPEPGEVLFLDRVGEQTSQGVWRLDREKILRAIEDGLTIDEVSGFLESHSSEPIPATVATLLADLRQRAGRLRDKGTVRMIECADAETARMLVLDPKLKTLCLLAGGRSLVFRDADETAVRNQLRKLGFVVPSRE
jgi:hypothetical protein